MILLRQHVFRSRYSVLLVLSVKLPQQIVEALQLQHTAQLAAEAS